MKKYIEFKKQRELGDILSDTFGFIRNEFKPFIKAVLQISGPYLILFLISLSFYIYVAGDTLNFQIGQEINSTTNLGMMLIALLFFMITGVLAYVFANSTIIHYIKSYINNEGKVDILQVKQEVKQTLMSFLGLSILKWLTLIVAMVFCLLPVLYFMVPMFVVFCVLVFENKDATEAYSYSYKLISSEFWITLATIIVIGLIVMVAGYAFSMPAVIYSIVKMGVFSGEMDPSDMSSFADPIYILLNIISYLFKFLLNIILTVSSVFIYFNLNERLHFTGTLERIQSLGNTEE